MEKEKQVTKFVISNILVLGLVSFFTDVSVEMVYPILPIYLSTVLGGSPAIIGVIEGIAESLASVLKLFSGLIADKYDNKKQLAFIGYASSFFNKLIILLSTSWLGVLLARVVDRFGKGIRTAPRDALVAESAEKGELGKAFGIHKTLDLLGSSLGIITAFFLLSASPDNYKQLFIISMIPAIIGALLVLAVKDKKTKSEPKKLEIKWRGLDRRLKFFIIIIFFFTLGNSSNAFLLLRAKNVGFSSTETILLYFVFNIVASILSYPIGKLSDKIGRKYTLSFGYLLYGLVYLGMGLLNSRLMFWGLFVVYGLYNALTAGGERALIAETSPKQLKASALGLHSAVVGVGLLPASIIAGWLWSNFGEVIPFVFGGCLALFASISVFIILSGKNTNIE